MAHLIYYSKENEFFKEEFNKTLINSEATRIIIKKLLKHYKLGNIEINFTSGRNHSCAGKWQITINLTNQNNFGVICHEMAHVYQAKKEDFKSGDKWHTKHHKTLMKRMLNYCRKKNWFEQELNRRLTPKPEKPAPSKQDIRQTKILKTEQKISKYEKKIISYGKRLAKAKRSLTMLKKHL